jgi:hypothetical protein
MQNLSKDKQECAEMKLCDKWKKYKIVPAALFSALFIFLVWYKSGIYFETNDDRYIASILSGVITGSPNAHVSYVNYILSMLIYILYKISSIISLSVPWYGMTLIFFHWLACAAILNSAYLRCKNYIQIIIVTCMTGIYFLAYYYMQGEIQYTSTAMILAMSGYFCLVMHIEPDMRKGLTYFFVLELLGCLLRSQAMLIVQPMGAAVSICLLLISKKDSLTINIKNMANILIVLAVVGIIGALGNLAEGNYTGELKAYREFDDCEIKMFDYYGKPDYMDVKDILDKYNVTEKEYNAYLNYTVIDNNIPLECEKELAEYASQNHTRQISEIQDGLKSIYIENSPWNINRFSLCAFVFLICLIIVCGEIRLFFPTVVLAAAQVFTWGILFYRGRVLMRVTVPVFACSALMCMALIIECVSKNDKSEILSSDKIKQNIVLAVGCALLIFTGFSSARKQYRYVHETNEGQCIFMEGMREIIAYCEEHGDNRYVLEAVSMGNYHGSALESGIYHPSNYVLSGGWFSNMPDVKERMDTYLEDGEEIYLIIFSDGNEANHSSVKYLEEYTGRSAECVDTIVTSPGGNYTVYRF